MKRLSLLLALMLTLMGCVQQSTSDVIVLNQDPVEKFFQDSDQLGDQLALESELHSLFANANTSEQASLFVYPMADYTSRITLKHFGTYIAPGSGDRFSGYHTGDDVEVDDQSNTVPVYALTNVTLVQKSNINGYGGVVIIEFVDGDTTYHALYGHLDLATVTANVGDTIVAGAKLGELGDDASEETDGERKHLHFSIFPYTGAELVAGYVDDVNSLDRWVNPSTFLNEHQAVLSTNE